MLKKLVDKKERQLLKANIKLVIYTTKQIINRKIITN